MSFKREIYYILFNRLKEKRRFIQVVAGPRQVGKTTMVQQIQAELPIHTYYGSADDQALSTNWIEQQWFLGRQLAKAHGEAVLILDEIQKISRWSGIVKHLWDEDTAQALPLKIVLLGSTPLLIQHELTESLAGRFEKIIATHWSYTEMQQAFRWTLPQHIYFGGYPGAAPLIEDESRWRAYLKDSLIETTVARDILLLHPIHKPALLRHLFEFACHYSSQILSYQKMMGQLQDAGNTTTLAHYLTLLQEAGMVAGIQKYAGGLVRQRASSPKLQVLNTGLLSAQAPPSFERIVSDPAGWGRLVESSVGAYLLNSAMQSALQVYYWREANREVDFIVTDGDKKLAIEVKSDGRKTTQSGLKIFCERYPNTIPLLVGGQNLPVEQFLATPLTTWFRA